MYYCVITHEKSVGKALRSGINVVNSTMIAMQAYATTRAVLNAIANTVGFS